MSVPSVEELVEHRAAIVVTLPSICTILHTTETSDGMGGTTDTEAESDPIPCRRADLSGQEMVKAARITPTPTCKILLPWGTSLLEKDMIKMGSRKFDVSFIDTDDFGLLTGAWCTEDR